ncbi:MAG: DUF1573 domain-containing protein [Candidatus Aminicenantes bacterium]|nr:DUF1573 domain-containing protein [Candidatus Aminicenantes bacterium]
MRVQAMVKRTAIILAAFLAFGALPLAAAKSARIQFKESAWNFGKVKEGVVLSHDFTFKNAGDADLVIEKVRTSCGCAAALVSDKTIAPGREGKVEVTFDTRSYSGKVTKYVYVDTNDPAEPNKELTVSADIEIPPRPRINVDPYNIDLGLLLEGDPVNGRFVVLNQGELELKVECVHRDAKYFVKGKPAAASLKVAAGKEVEVEFRIPSETRSSTIREYILIKSNDPIRSTVSVYISGFLISREQLKDLFKRYKDLLKG